MTQGGESATNGGQIAVLNPKLDQQDDPSADRAGLQRRALATLRPHDSAKCLAQARKHTPSSALVSCM